VTFLAIAGVFVLVVGAVLGLAATKPDAFSIQRTASIKAPPEKIFPYVNDLNNWVQWSPFEKLDPAMKRKVSGAPAGKGAVYEWDGNSKAGQGRMEIVESSPASKVGIKLDFIRPFEGHNTATFALQPQGDSTSVTWSMNGPAPFISKVMQVFCDMDAIIGKDFEEGLAKLKGLAEK
jgi:uncharacterized protein YndB with AHSA1/START domain